MKSQSFGKILLAFVIVLFFTGCQNQKENARSKIDLAGQWQFALDTNNVGIQEKWYKSDLQGVIKLPGTTDLNQKGFLNTDTTTKHLNRVYKYEGPAWYKKKVNIPNEFEDQHIELILERTKSSMIWIDVQYIGKSYILQSPQHYDASKYLTPGEHIITLRVDNSLELTPYGQVHIYTDETQTNWNGIIGDILLEASPKTYITDLQVYPDINNKKINVELSLDNGLNLENIDVELKISRESSDDVKELKSLRKTIPCDSVIQIEYSLDDEMLLWDDYEQPLYKLTAIISNDSLSDNKTVPFGMRDFAVDGKQFTINGRTTFLRGKHEAAVFPLTGHTPMNVEEWKRVYEIAKSYGINHYRFHSYCPPEAAFEAADQVGIFLQPELPFWGGLESDTVAAKLKNEGIALLKSYANHPSFVMFGPGNEIWSGHDRIEEIMLDLIDIDGRPLYTMGANNNIGYIWPREYSEFYLAVRTPSDGDTILTHTRLAHGFVDSEEGGILNSVTPSTTINFDYPVEQIDIPFVSHEIGQYQIYPDYKEINKYTGVVRAWNLGVFKNRLERAGMLDQNIDFHKASGAWSAICYKAEMEAAFRTENFAGFQLLDLQDYPGQGTALVGILDAFMDSKEVISREEWLESCNDVVLLLEFPKYCWRNNENFEARLKVANYSNKSLKDEIEWEIVNQHGIQIDEGNFTKLEIENANLSCIGEIRTKLDEINSAEKLTINLVLKKSGYTNSYPIWVYPEPKSHIDHENIIIADKLDDQLISEIQSGGKVLLFPTHKSIKDKTVGGLFPPDFWNYGMFKSISESVGKPVSPGTLGILTNPEHPLFYSFPTDFHTNYQWFSIVKASRPLILNKTQHHYRPIVQVIDNLERNNKLGLIFEFSVGKGKLLVCMSNLNENLDKPEAYQLYRSIIEYMKSSNFKPGYSVDGNLLFDLL